MDAKIGIRRRRDSTPANRRPARMCRAQLARRRRSGDARDLPASHPARRRSGRRRRLRDRRTPRTSSAGGNRCSGRKMPHIVAEHAGVVVGYAYAVPFRKRPAYRYTVKHSIYVRSDHLQRGIGRQLMAALIDACAAAGFRQMIGYIDARQPRLARAARGVRFPPGRLSALGRLQIRPLDGHGDGPALARAGRDGAADGAERPALTASPRPARSGTPPDPRL